MGMSRNEARDLRIAEALGAHLIADAYRDTFPDNEQDAKHLRKQETFWRLTARAWLLDADAERCHEKAKQRMANSPEFKMHMDKLRAGLGAKPNS